MTDVLGWHRIGDRETWADDLETQHKTGEERLTDPRRRPAQWSEEIFAEDRPCGMVEDLPQSLVDAYVNRAMLHSYTREIEPGTWFATVVGLDGAWADGDTASDARTALAESLLGWIAVKRRLGHEIPAIEGLDLNLPRSSST